MTFDLSGPVGEVAATLLGGTIAHGPVTIRITEVEAYEGADDPASHAYRGRTERNAVMFGPAGHLYLYFSYGMHWAANIVCGPEGQASGVLLRSGEVIEGIEVARSRRGRSTDRDLARGPGRLTQALGLSSELKGVDVLGDGPVRLTPPQSPPPLTAATPDPSRATPDQSPRISTGPRVGVSVEADRPWRFWLTGDPYVSDYRRSPRAPAQP